MINYYCCVADHGLKVGDRVWVNGKIHRVCKISSHRTFQVKDGNLGDKILTAIYTCFSGVANWIKKI